MERGILDQIVWTSDERVILYYGSIDVPADCLILDQRVVWEDGEWVQDDDAFPDGGETQRAQNSRLRFVLKKYGIPKTILPLEAIRTHSPKRLRSLAEAVSALGSDRIHQFFQALRTRGIIPIAYLGGGGWGFVFHAREGRKNIALKVIKPPYDPDWVRRFSREAIILRKLAPKAPNAVAPRLEEVSDLLCIHMELVKGRPLAELSLPTTPYVASILVYDILQELAPVHEAGIVHRDLHLGNVMMRNSGKLALVDFGLAREEQESGVSETFRPAGTMSHCAPEKWLRPSKAGPQSDIFSVGVMLYKLLTGTYPFWADTYIALYELIKRGLFEPASLRNPNVPPMFDIVLREMLAPDPTARPADATQAFRLMEHIFVLEGIRTRQST